MDFTDWLWIKLIGGAVIIFVVNFIYTWITGRSIQEARREGREKSADRSADR